MGEFGIVRDLQDFTFEEVHEMRASRLWKTYRTIHLERALKSVPSVDKRVLRIHVAGKKFQ